ncbi:MAG: YDG domain-containing protein [Firmicutes bacterium]|nr:YDG domain-containing protein [Bacillota bacterium]
MSKSRFTVFYGVLPQRNTHAIKIFALIASVFIGAAVLSAGNGSNAVVAAPDISWYSAAVTEFVLSDANELAGLAQLVNSGNDFSGKTITLSGDISLAAYGAGYNSGKGWIPIGTASQPFKGVFDGDMNTITDLFVSNTVSTGDMGLFGYTAGATIKNLGLEGSVKGHHRVGGLVGYAYSGSIVENCCFSGTVEGTGPASSIGVGGLAGGVANGSKVRNCYTLGTVTSTTNNVGGIAGYVTGSGSSIETCWAAGDVIGTGSAGNIGGIAGLVNSSGSVTNCAAFNNLVAGPSNVGRVIGNTAGGNSSSNMAFAGMSGAAYVTENNVPLKTVPEIARGGAFTGVFESASWTKTPGKLPGLFGNTAELPEHLRIDLSGIVITLGGFTNLDDTFTYNSSEQIPTVTAALLGEVLTESADFDIVLSTEAAGLNAGIDAGDVILTLVGKGIYKGSASETYVIKKAELSLSASGTVVAEKIYDGTTAGRVTAVGFSGLQGGDSLDIGWDYAVVSALYDDANAGTAKTLDITVALLPGSYAANNYALASGILALSGQTIEKDIYKGVSHLFYAYLYPEEYDDTMLPYDLSQLPFQLLSGRNFGAKEYNVISVYGDVVDTAVIMGEALEVTPTNYHEEDDMGVIYIQLVTENYKGWDTGERPNIEIYVCVVSIASTLPGITIDPIDDITYGETLDTPGVHVVNYVGSYHDSYSGVMYNGVSYALTTAKPTLPGRYTYTAWLGDPGLSPGGKIFAIASRDFEIKRTPLLVTAPGGIAKEYDGKTGLVLHYFDDEGDTLAVNGIIGADFVTVAVAINFASANAGTHHVTPAGLSLDGTDGWKYTASPEFAGGTIEPRRLAEITDVIMPLSRQYDGTTTVALTGGMVWGAVTGEKVGLGSLTGSVADKNVGVGKEVFLTGVTLTGADAANYYFDTSMPLFVGFLDITPRVITVTEGSYLVKKTYDGTTAPGKISGNLNISGILPGDGVSVTWSAPGAYGGAEAGSYPLSLLLTLQGDTAGNYILADDTVSVTGVIEEAKKQNNAWAFVLGGLLLVLLLLFLDSQNDDKKRN